MELNILKMGKNSFKVERKILLVIDSFGLGGAQTSIRNLFKNINRNNFQFDLAVLHSKKVENDLYNLFSNCWFISKSKYDPRILFRLGRIIRKNKYDIVHTHLIPSSFICEKFRRLYKIKRLIVHIHAPFGDNLDYEYQNFLSKMMYKNVDMIIGVSKKVTDSVPSMRLKRTLYNSVDGTLFNVLDENQKLKLRKKWGLDENDFVLGMVGRITTVKNPMILCDAVKVLVLKHQNVKLIFVGKGMLEDKIKNYVKKNNLENNVIFAGYQKNINEFMNMFDVYVLSSFCEGHPMSLIEAMMCRVPCISSNWDGVEEIIDDGRNGLLFENDDLKELTGSIQKLIDNVQYRKKIADNAYNFSSSNFSIENKRNELLKYYSDIINQVK